ncbi:MAG: S8 family serine peptidase [Chloroflexota bacterium]
MSTSFLKWAVVTLFLFGTIATFVPIISDQTFDYEAETRKVVEYISKREAIPATQLAIVNQHRRDYQILNKSFWMVTALDTSGNNWYTAMVDLGDGSFVDEIDKIEQAERNARLDKYGKFEPILYEQLQFMKAEEKVQVALWVAGAPKRSQSELYASLAAQYPEAKQALQLSGKPFDVRDPEMVGILEAEYMQMLAEDTEIQIYPLVNALQAQGYSITAFEALPAVVVTLPKSMLLEIAKRDDIGMVYLAGRMQKAELDTAVPTILVPPVWQRGYRGNGVNIAILEAGKVDFTGPAGHNYLHQGQVRTCTMGEEWHKTFVASISASYHGFWTGVAPDATIVDACTNGNDVDTVSALSWATSIADPINASIAFVDDGQLHFVDRAFDHYARNGNDTVVVSAGNFNPDTTYVSSPGLGWNVITVGAFDNKENSDWWDDVMWSDSKWKNPPGTDREKPEVVAPGVLISALKLDNNPTTANGTSASAPQVAGLAALLIDRDGSLDIWPEALKAIIMASATHNIDGPTGIPTGQDLKDGAGGINASLADSIAQVHNLSATNPCTTSCWWASSITDTNFPDNYLYRYFTADKGDFIRIAIAWWSDVNCPDPGSCSYDQLDTNLNLGAQKSNGGTWDWVSGAWSASYSNNYELIEFVAPESGNYRIAVHKASTNVISNSLGIALVRLRRIYLPLIMSGTSSRSLGSNPYPSPSFSSPLPNPYP